MLPNYLCCFAGYNLITDFSQVGLKEADFPSRVIRDEFIYTSTLNNELRIASFGEFDGWNTELNPPITEDLKTQAGRMFPPLNDAIRYIYICMYDTCL